MHKCNRIYSFEAACHFVCMFLHVFGSAYNAEIHRLRAQISFARKSKKSTIANEEYSSQTTISRENTMFKVGPLGSL